MRVPTPFRSLAPICPCRCRSQHPVLGGPSDNCCALSFHPVQSLTSNPKPPPPPPPRCTPQGPVARDLAETFCLLDSRHTHIYFEWPLLQGLGPHTLGPSFPPSSAQTVPADPLPVASHLSDGRMETIAPENDFQVTESHHR